MDAKTEKDIAILNMTPLVRSAKETAALSGMSLEVKQSSLGGTMKHAKLGRGIADQAPAGQNSRF
jgi:hypothetical protein